jgi:hypothetical protein
MNTETQIENHENIIYYFVHRKKYSVAANIWEFRGHVVPNFLKLTGPHSNPEAHIISNKKYRVRK